jgi:hypothetical protein
MPSILGLCPTRRSTVFSWFFGRNSSSASHTKLTVEVSTGNKERNRIVNTTHYNLRPRRTAVNYKEPASDAEDSDASSEA